ncbi:MAG: hypothetical protein QE263_06755 [Vampirovibrionales bacterium]|nr:hypothetical protein [Vampirovibrionales bacterium]
MQIQNRLNTPNFGKIFNVQYYLNRNPVTPQDLVELKKEKHLPDGFWSLLLKNYLNMRNTNIVAEILESVPKLRRKLGIIEKLDIYTFQLAYDSQKPEDSYLLTGEDAIKSIETPISEFYKENPPKETVHIYIEDGPHSGLEVNAVQIKPTPKNSDN